jgi:hypothetical protein
MKNIRTYLAAACAVTFFAGSFLLNGIYTSRAATTTDKPEVTVVNTTANPVPIVAQGTTNVSGTVSANIPGSIAVSNFPGLQSVAVSNFPNTQRVAVTNFPNQQQVTVSNFPQTQAVGPAGTPVVLQAILPAFGHIRLPLSPIGAGSGALSGRLAIGSITATAQNADGDNAIDVFLLTTDCNGNDLERLNLIEIKRGSTSHISFPTPQLTPFSGARNRFCVEADVYPNSGDSTIVYVTLAGSLR